VKARTGVGENRGEKLSVSMHVIGIVFGFWDITFLVSILVYRKWTTDSTSLWNLDMDASYSYKLMEGKVLTSYVLRNTRLNFLITKLALLLLA